MDKGRPLPGSDSAGDSPLARAPFRRWMSDAAKMSRFGAKTERLFDWLLSDLCSRFGMRIGALGQVPTFRTISGAALWDSGPII